MICTRSFLGFLTCLCAATQVQTASGQAGANTRNQIRRDVALGVGEVSRQGRWPTRRKGQYIISGFSVDAATQMDYGLVMVNTCSGVLLTNEWALTAGHCVNRAPSVTIKFLPAGDPNAQTNTSSQVYVMGWDLPCPPKQTPPGPGTCRGYDLALVKSSAPFRVNGSTTNFVNTLFDPSGARPGKAIQFFGQGVNVAGPGQPGLGQWRFAGFSIASVVTSPPFPDPPAPTDPNPRRAYPPSVTVNSNAFGQILAPGDSGGPAFFVVLGPQGSQSQLGGIGVRADAMTADINLLPVGLIGVVIQGTWAARDATDLFDVLQGELAQLNLMSGVLDLNLRDWASSERAANELCFNRGYTTGHFDGHEQVDRGRFGLVCSTAGVAFRDVTVTEVNSTSWSFSDINAVPWAQAMRAASDLCARANQGFVGGHFTGNVGPGVFGLVCYMQGQDGAGAQWMDAPDAQINAGPWPSGSDLNAVPWAQAARAAHAFCNGKGFISGFMTGHQTADRKGVVCQKF
jgi:Trypsin